jgi:REP element-mobilizing transposase RayT
MSEHRGWHSRGYLPHRDEPGLIQAITFHLADSLPLHLLYPGLPPAEEQEAYRDRVQGWLDVGWGGCLLSDSNAAAIVENLLLDRDGQSYVLLAWVIMPNHVHALIETKVGMPLERILHGWKGYSARQINDLLARQGALWRPEYFDRYIRDEEHLEKSVLYIHGNPVRAGLIEDPRDWEFGSARRVETLDSTWHTPYAGRQ